METANQIMLDQTIIVRGRVQTTWSSDDDERERKLRRGETQLVAS